MRNAELTEQVRSSMPAVRLDDRSIHSAFRIPNSALA